MATVDLLQHIGLNKYEAEAYYALLTHGPLTGYEVGKSSLTTVVDGKESTYVCDYVVIWKPQKEGSYRAHTDIFN